jgi:hypothetical protein
MIITKRCLSIQDKYWIEVSNTPSGKVKIEVPTEITGAAIFEKEEAIELADLIRETAYSIPDEIAF